LLSLNRRAVLESAVLSEEPFVKDNVTTNGEVDSSAGSIQCDFLDLADRDASDGDKRLFREPGGVWEFGVDGDSYRA
jgi:hypothetical protein